jgi:hypothetical protein
MSFGQSRIGVLRSFGDVTPFPARVPSLAGMIPRSANRPAPIATSVQ